MKTTRRLFAILLVLTMLLTNSGIAALAEAVLNMPAALQIIDEEAFYGSTSIGKVVLSNNVTEIRARAFANSTLSEINLPDSLTFIDESAFDGPDKVTVTANAGSWAYNWAVEHGYINPPTALEITKVNCSVDGAIPLNKTVLWAVSTEADSDVQYEFVLLRRTKEVARQDYSAKNSFRYTFTNSGNYTLQISCEDEDGNKASTTSSHTVQAGPLTMVSVSTKSFERIVGDEITWQVETSGGHDPLTYSYELSRNGTVINSVDSSESSEYSYTANQAGSYVLSATCIDADATIVSLASDPVVVVGNVAMPVIKNAFGNAEANAPEYKNDVINVEWETVSGASAYNIELSEKVGENFEEILKTSVSEDSANYILQKDLFAAITQKTLYRLSLSATGIGESDADVKYFYVLPIDKTLKVNSKSAITWNQASAYSSERSFTVQSDLPWTASTDVNWLSYSIADDVTLSVSMGERTSFNGVRTGHIVVSNGINSATITVHQNTKTAAPEFNYPRLSTNPDNPTTVAAGPFPYEYDKNGHNYVVMQTYELRSGEWVCIRTDEGGDAGILGNLSCDTYKDNTQYKYELKGCYSSEYENNEIATDALTTTYYAYMDADKQVMTVNGVENLATTITDELAVDVYSTNLWTVSTDVNWLTFGNAPTRATYKNSFTISAAANTTGAARNGHVYFSTNMKTATVTLTQPNGSTQIISPANISQNVNSPTTLTYGTVIRLGSPNLEHTAAVLENGSWRNAYDVESTVEEETMKFRLKEADRVDGRIVRWTFSDGVNTSTYYVQVRMPSTTPFVKIHTNLSYSPYDGIFEWEASKTQSILPIKLRANAAWTATSNVSWLTVSSTSGSATDSDLTLNVTIGANTSGAVRIGEIAFANDGVNCSWLKVIQGTDDYIQILDKTTKAAYDPSVDYKHENGERHSIELAVSCNGKWAAQCNDSWLSTDFSTSYAKVTNVYLSRNTTSSPRTGSVTFSYGTASTTIYITQEPYMGEPVITAPAWSTSGDSPTIAAYADVTVEWNAISSASYYEITNTWGDHTSNNAKWMTVQEAGKSTYSAVIPMDWFVVGTDSIQHITVIAYNAFGHASDTDSLCFYMTTDAALIGGRTNQTWDKVDDQGDSNTFIITSSANWTARSNNSWITIDKTSGSNGDSLSVTAAKNAGAKRTGSVTVTVNGNTSTLTVVQCAVLLDDPLIEPAYAPRLQDATQVSAGSARITMSWTSEEQVLFYKARLYQLDDEYASVWSVIESSDYLRNNSAYTFDTLQLEAGKLYDVCLERHTPSDYSRFHRYFTATQTGTTIEVDTTEIEFTCGERSYPTSVNSGAQWVAISNDNWLMVDREPVTQAIMDDQETSAADYAMLAGNSGDRLYISALANTNSQARTGSVTIRSGGATTTIHVTQYQYYELAEIIEPSLSTASDTPTLLPYSPLTVYWTKAEGGTGNYSISLYESDTPRIGFKRLFRDEGITARTYVIPEFRLTENKYYNLVIGTEVVAGDYYANNYYFYIDSANPLRATLTLSDEEATVGSYFGVTVSASGGTGDYRYAYQLLRKGEIVQQTAYDTMASYTFVTDEDDIYSIRVYVKDSSGAVITVDSDDFVASQPASAVLSGEVLVAEENYYFSDYGNEGVTVTITPVEDANASVNTARSTYAANSTVYTTTTDKDGKWKFLTGIAGADYRITYTKTNYQFVSGGTFFTAAPGYNQLETIFGTPTNEAITPDAIAFNTYEDRDIVNITKLSGSLTINWPVATNATSYIYSVKLLDGQPNSAEDESGSSLARNVTTEGREINIDKSKLKTGQWLKVWVASVSVDGLRANNTIYLFLTDCDMAGEVVFDHYVDRQMLYLEDIDDLLTITWKDASSAVKYLVTAKILKGNPTSCSADEEITTLYYRDTLDSIPIAKKDLVPGTYLKVAVASVNSGDKERWSILNLYIESSAPDPNITENIELDPWFGDSAAYQNHTNDVAYAHVKKRMNDIIIQSWAQTELREGRSIVFMFEGAGADSNTNRRMNALCIVVKNDNQGIPSLVFRNEYCSTIPDVVNEVNDYYVTTKGYKNCKNGTGTVLGGVYNFSATTYGEAKALSINGGGDVSSVRFKNTADKGTVTTSDGILLHRRYKNYRFTQPDSSRNSIGCFLIGKEESFKDTLSDFVNNSGRYGKVVVDRVCAVDYLRGIYGDDQAALLYTYNK